MSLSEREDSQEEVWLDAVDPLEGFECPFKQDCNTPRQCPFGHSGDTLPLRKVPPFICSHYLIDCCRLNSTDHAVGGLTRCPIGFHPTFVELIDLDRYVEKIAASVLTNDCQQAPQEGGTARGIKRRRDADDRDDDLECLICWEKVLSHNQHYGLLEQCTHVFCASCIIQWYKSGQPGQGNEYHACPYCRVPSKRIVVTTRMMHNGLEKKRLFQLQLKAAQVFQQIEADELLAQRRANIELTEHGTIHFQMNETEFEARRMMRTIEFVADQQERRQALLAPTENAVRDGQLDVQAQAPLADPPVLDFAAARQIRPQPANRPDPVTHQPPPRFRLNRAAILRANMAEPNRAARVYNFRPR